MIFCHATTNQKHAHVTEGGWDRLHDHVRMLGERDGNDKPLAESNKDDNGKYGKDGNILNDNDNYAIGIDSVNETLDEGGNRRCPRTSMPCKSAAERALTLRASYSRWAALRG